MKYRHKVVISGNITEIYSYEKEVCTGKDANENKNGRRGKKSKVEDWEEHKRLKDKNRGDVLKRAQKRLRRQINANVDAWGERSKFFTLTYAENMQDIKESNYNFNKFIKRLNYKLKIKLKYSCVIEFQKRGAIHYHLVTYNLPFTDVNLLADIWGHGFVKINAIDDIDNVGAYVTKYMSKDNDDERLRGEKCYFSSRGLKESEEKILDEKEIESLADSLDQHKVYDVEFENDYLGKIAYKQYNLKRK